jgi:hypothetical protein
MFNRPNEVGTSFESEVCISALCANWQRLAVPLVESAVI